MNVSRKSDGPRIWRLVLKTIQRLIDQAFVHSLQKSPNPVAVFIEFIAPIHHRHNEHYSRRQDGHPSRSHHPWRSATNLPIEQCEREAGNLVALTIMRYCFFSRGWELRPPETLYKWYATSLLLRFRWAGWRVVLRGNRRIKIIKY